MSMGSFDGAEVCELVGLFLLNRLAHEFNNRENTGLYRDDGLASFKNMRPRIADKLKKRFTDVFHNIRPENYYPVKSESCELFGH